MIVTQQQGHTSDMIKINATIVGSMAKRRQLVEMTAGGGRKPIWRLDTRRGRDVEAFQYYRYDIY